jgi:hypothetical protein
MQHVHYNVKIHDGIYMNIILGSEVCFSGTCSYTMPRIFFLVSQQAMVAGALLQNISQPFPATAPDAVSFPFRTLK